MRLLLEWWYAMERRLDVQILWPACKRTAIAQGQAISDAKAAFAYHAFHDDAWLCLGDEEIQRRINSLT